MPDRVQFEVQTAVALLGNLESTTWLPMQLFGKSRAGNTFSDLLPNSENICETKNEKRSRETNLIPGSEVVTCYTHTVLKLATAWPTARICSSVISGNIGSETSCAATCSDTGNEPEPYPKSACAGIRWTGIG